MPCPRSVPTHSLAPTYATYLTLTAPPVSSMPTVSYRTTHRFPAGAHRLSPPHEHAHHLTLSFACLGFEAKADFFTSRSHLCSTALTAPYSSLHSCLLSCRAVRAAGHAPPRARTNAAPPRRPFPKLVPSALFPRGRPIVAGHPRSTSVPTGTSPSFTIAPQCSTAPPTAPKTTDQPPSLTCLFCQGSPSWIALVSFFQSHFHPQIGSPHARAAHVTNPHSLTAGHRRN
jgi:hypothetical protein